MLFNRFVTSSDCNAPLIALFFVLFVPRLNNFGAYLIAFWNAVFPKALTVGLLVIFLDYLETHNLFVFFLVLFFFYQEVQLSFCIFSSL